MDAIQCVGKITEEFLACGILWSQEFFTLEYYQNVYSLKVVYVFTDCKIMLQIIYSSSSEWLDSYSQIFLWNCDIKVCNYTYKASHILWDIDRYLIRFLVDRHLRNYSLYKLDRCMNMSVTMWKREYVWHGCSLKIYNILVTCRGGRKKQQWIFKNVFHSLANLHLFLHYQYLLAVEDKYFSDSKCLWEFFWRNYLPPSHLVESLFGIYHQSPKVWNYKINLKL